MAVTAQNKKKSHLRNNILLLNETDSDLPQFKCKVKRIGGRDSLLKNYAKMKLNETKIFPFQIGRRITDQARLTFRKFTHNHNRKTHLEEPLFSAASEYKVSYFLTIQFTFNFQGICQKQVLFLEPIDLMKKKDKENASFWLLFFF